MMVMACSKSSSNSPRRNAGRTDGRRIAHPRSVEPYALEIWARAACWAYRLAMCVSTIAPEITIAATAAWISQAEGTFTAPRRRARSRRRPCRCRWAARAGARDQLGDARRFTSTVSPDPDRGAEIERLRNVDRARVPASACPAPPRLGSRCRGRGQSARRTWSWRQNAREMDRIAVAGQLREPTTSEERDGLDSVSAIPTRGPRSRECAGSAWRYRAVGPSRLPAEEAGEHLRVTEHGVVAFHIVWPHAGTSGPGS